MTIQATSNLALIATSSASFTVIVAVEKLPISSDGNRTDFGAYMPTPLHGSGTTHFTYLLSLHSNLKLKSFHFV